MFRSNSSNKDILPLRALPIAAMLVQLVERMLKTANEQRELAKGLDERGMDLTPYALEQREKGLAVGRSTNCQVIYKEGTRIRASVSRINARGLLVKQDVEVDSAAKTVTCKCRWYDEFKYPCFCAWGLIVKEDLSPNDPGWFDERYHVTSMMEAYACEPPVMALQGHLKAEMLIPPEHKNLPGRPKKRQSRHQARLTTKTRKISCASCGGTDHYHMTCTKPSTKHRMEKFGIKAWDWAVKQSDVNAEDCGSFFNK